MHLEHLTRDELLELHRTAETEAERRAIRRRLAELDTDRPAPRPVRAWTIPQLPAGWAHDPALRADVLAELGPDRPVTGERCAAAVDAVARRQRTRGVNP